MSLRSWNLLFVFFLWGGGGVGMNASNSILGLPLFDI